jgi:hypothetical protein
MLDAAIPAMFATATLALAVLIWLDLQIDRLPWVEVLLLIAWVAISYWSLWRVIYRLDYREGKLECRSRFARWVLDASVIVRLRPARLPGYEVIELRGEPRRLMTCISRGFAAFASALQWQHPNIAVDFSPVGRYLERVPWPSSFEEL